MHIQFDSKNKNEVLAAKAALDYLAAALEETVKAPPVVNGTPDLPKPRPFQNRNRPNVLFENRLSQNEREKYPGLYRLAVIILERMEPERLYALSEVREFMVHVGHPASSGSAVLTHLLQKGCVERPMKALYKRVK